jgi:hypothetical protein
MTVRLVPERVESAQARTRRTAAGFARDVIALTKPRTR